MNHFRVSLLMCGVALCAAPGVAAERPKTGAIRFNRDVRSILSDKCFRCHGPDAAARTSDLRLDDREVAVGKLDSGATAIVPGNAAASELVRRITSGDEYERMPPPDSGKSLSPEEIAILKRWIDEGATWDKHWSLIPPERPPLPDVDDVTWCRTPLDRFVLARLEVERLTPSPEADRITLIRRLSFDLLGLPPSVEEVDAFLADERPEAYERLVDRLMASPHFGERLAVYWLDLVRYADTVGYHGDQEREISGYRDYVIRAFNADLPFDRFTVEQVAGDLLPDATLWQKVASGYNMLGMTSIEGGVQPKEYLAKYAADRVRTTASVWLGATLGCAECHDHKFDPYSTRDFYRFAAFFADIQQGGKENPEPNLPLPTGGEATRRTIVPVSGPPRITRVLGRGDWMDETGEIVLPGVPESIGRLARGGESERATRLDLARWLVQPEHPQVSRVFVNRLWKLYFGTGLSRVLDDVGSQGEWPTHPELLDWLAVEFVGVEGRKPEGRSQQSEVRGPESTAPSAAGSGPQPSTLNPQPFSIKHMVRQIVTSAAYRQSSFERPELQRVDPGNRLLGRQSRWRIEAEFIRDQALAASGLLVRQIGGDSVRPYQQAGYYAYLNFPKRTYVASTGDDQYRRGVYTHWQRTFLHPTLLAFDAPSREECTAERPRSNTPLAALALLNDPSFVEAARVFAESLLAGSGDDQTRMVSAWRQALSRHPEPRELELLERLLDNQRRIYAADPQSALKLLGIGQHPRDERVDPSELAAWAAVTRAILNLNEAVTRN